MHKILSIAKHWAIMPEMLQSLASEKEAFSFSTDPPLKNTRSVSMREGTAILPIKGAIMAQDNLFSYLLGGTTLESFVQDFQKVLHDDSVKAILLDIDSPGGVAVGPCEVADMIYKAREKKPVWAYIGRHGCSAAYWLASAAEKVIANRSAMVGSIGVVTAVPIQEEPDAQGYRSIEIVSSNAANKRPDPRTADGMSEIRRELDALETEFINGISKYRNVSTDTVRRDFGRGGVLLGAEAKSSLMVDYLSTFEEVMSDLSTIHHNHQNKGEITMTKGTETVAGDALNKEQITADYIKKEFPDIHKAFKQEGFSEGEAKGTDDIKAAAIKEGQKSERERLLAIEKAVLPGHEDLVAKAKADPEMTAEKLALQIVSAEKEKGGDFLKAAKAAEESLPEIKPGVATAAPQEKTMDESAPLADRADAEWKKDSNLRAEFGDDYDSYLAFRQAEENGQVKILGNKGGQ
ncbi:MAG: S49 family peptidase [Alphaproteobacteria bacterium]